MIKFPYEYMQEAISALHKAEDLDLSHPDTANAIALAQVRATLALASMTGLLEDIGNSVRDVVNGIYELKSVVEKKK